MRPFFLRDLNGRDPSGANCRSTSLAVGAAERPVDGPRAVAQCRRERPFGFNNFPAIDRDQCLLGNLDRSSRISKSGF